MIVKKRGGIITVVMALVSRQDTLEVPVNLFLAKNRHTASSPFLERVSPQGCMRATGQNITVAILLGILATPATLQIWKNKPRRLEPII
jgi:hypothetical protein